MSFVENILSPVFKGVLALLLLVWVIFCVHKGLEFMGVYKLITRIKLRRKVGSKFVWDDEKIKFCTKAMFSGWKYKDFKKFAEGCEKGDEIIYTYLLLEKVVDVKNVQNKPQSKFVVGDYAHKF